MDYEKEYKSLVAKVKKAHQFAQTDSTKSVLEEILPQLSESDDERTWKWLVDYFSSIKATVWIPPDITCEQILAYLEKQKYDRMKPIYDARESFESALEKAWNDYHNRYENVDKLEDDYVECAHAKGFREGYLFGLEKQKEPENVSASTMVPSCWAEEPSLQKEQSMSEDERIRRALLELVSNDKACGYTEFYEKKGITCDYAIAYLEKQKEQKPEHFELKAGKWYFCHHAFCCRADHLTVQEGERFMCEKDGVVKGFVIKEPEKYFKECGAPAPMEDEQQEQKPTEWSEEDADILNCCISSIEEAKENRYAYKETDGDTSYDREIDWLKSLRPSWKPSEEEMKALDKAIPVCAGVAGKDEISPLISLYEQLKKL